jgi:hypothetical protein
MADAAWQAITSWSRHNKDELPQWKTDKFQASRVKKDVPRMEMVHHQDVTVEMSTCLLAA